MQQHVVSIADMEVTAVPAQDKIIEASSQNMADFSHSGRVTSVQVW